MTTIERLTRKLFEPVPSHWLAALRVLFGALMCVSMLRFIAYGWIEEFFVRPRLHFKYWGFSWIDVLPAPYMHTLFWVLAGLAACIALGVAFRVAAFAFWLGFTYLQLVDVTNYLNHYYLASLVALLLACSPAHRQWSVDARLGLAGSSDAVPRLWLWLFRFQIGVVYTFAGLAKFTPDWLLHGQPLGIWLGASTHLPLLGELFRVPGAPLAMSWAGFLFDTTIPWLLSVRRLRLPAYGVVLIFHTTTSLLFPIGMFPIIMTVCALVFFAPDWPVRLARLLRRAPGAERAITPAATITPEPTPLLAWQRFAVILAASYAAVHVLLPLRHLAYQGNVLWDEQGMRFSWRVMAREKNGSVTFLVRDPLTGKVQYVSPSRYLTRLQEREMSAQPDLVLQLAHHIAAEYRSRLGRDVEVRADAWVSLNGRRSTRLIDPRVDLTRVRDGVARASWILSAPAGPPPAIRPI